MVKKIVIFSASARARSIIPGARRLLLPSLISFMGHFDGSFADCGPLLVLVVLAEPQQMFQLLMG